MSAKSSFIATNWPDKILAVSLAEIGGRADEFPLLLLPPAACAPAITVSRAGSVARERDALAVSPVKDGWQAC